MAAFFAFTAMKNLSQIALDELYGVASGSPWFARERRPIPGGPARYSGKSVEPSGSECGWYRGSMAFRPDLSGRKVVFVSRRRETK